MILRILAQSHCDEYTGNFEPIENGKVVGAPLVLEALEDRFLGEVKQQTDNERNEVDNFEYQQNKGRYNIVHIPDYETSHQYEDYTNPNSRWCLTYDPMHWESYNPDGSKKIYFALKDGFENIPCEEGQNFPLDEYGLSMLCIQIDEFGNMTQCTSRWNHKGTHGNGIGNADQIMNPMDVSKVLGGSVFTLCPPYTKEELMENGIMPFEMIQDLLNQGKEIEWQSRKKSGLDNKIWVKYRKKWNLLDEETNQLLCKQWWSYVCDFKEGFARVSADNSLNFINTHGQLLSHQWFYNCCDFSEGFARVEIEDGEYNFIDRNGNFLLKDNQFLDNCHDFKDGFALIEDKYGNTNFINTNGQLISNKWWEFSSDFHEGFSAVKREEDEKWNFINKNGQLISNQWWKYAYGFNEGFARIQREDGSWNFINKNEQLISNQWWTFISYFDSGFAYVIRKDGQCFFIDKQGNLYDGDKNPIKESKQSVISRLLREELRKIS